MRPFLPLALFLAAPCAATARFTRRQHEPSSSSLATPSPLFILAPHALPLTYNAPLLNQWGFEEAPCATVPFLTARTGMVTGWICRTDGERRVLRAMDRILRQGCSPFSSPQKPPLVLDVGSNSGFYGLNAAAHGCRVAFFDAQPACQRVVAASIIVNQFADRAIVMDGGLSDRPSTLQADSNATCSFESGRFPMAQLEDGTLHRGDVDVPLYPLATLLPASTRILLVKIDTEGNEQRALAGMLPLFAARAIQHAVVEVTAGHGFWERQGVRPQDVADTMGAIAGHGYEFTNLSDGESGSVIGSDAETVRTFFGRRAFEQSDFLIDRV